MKLTFSGKITAVKYKVKVDDKGIPILNEDGNQIIIDGTRQNFKFDNEILNQGLNKIGTLGRIPIEVAYLSKTVDEAQITDGLDETFGVGLDKFVAGSNQIKEESELEKDVTSATDKYITYKRVFTFPAGVGTDTDISKIAIGWGSEDVPEGVWAAKLIKDPRGRPTSFEKYADESLDVIYELTIGVPDDDITSVINLNDDFDVIARPALLDSVWNFNNFEFLINGNGQWCSEPITDVNNRPQVGVLDDVITTASIEQYIDESYTLKYVFKAEFNEANSVDGISSLFIDGPMPWQMSFVNKTTNEPILKNSDYKLELPAIAMSWNRG